MAVLPNEIFINVDGGFESQENGKSKIQNGQEIKVTLSQNPIWGITCLKDDGEAQTFELTDTFSFVADNDFNAATTEPIRSPNSEFNVPGDWVSLDVVNGLISVRIDANTAELQTKLGTTNSEVELIGELQVFAAAATEPYIVSRFQVITRNLVDKSGVVPPPVITGFYSSAQVDSLLIDKEDLITYDSLPNIDVKSAAATNLVAMSGSEWGLVESIRIVEKVLTGAVTSDFTFKLGTLTDDDQYISLTTATTPTAIGDSDVYMLNEKVLLNSETLVFEVVGLSDATTHEIQVIPQIITFPSP